MVAESWFFRDERPFEWLREYSERVVKCTGAALLCGSSAWHARGVKSLIRSPSCFPNWAFPLDDTVLMPLTSVPADWRSPSARSLFTQCLPRLRCPVTGLVIFVSTPEGYELDPALRATVRFFQASILDPQAARGIFALRLGLLPQSLDLSRSSARATVLAVIDRVLAPDGLLVHRPCRPARPLRCRRRVHSLWRSRLLCLSSLDRAATPACPRFRVRLNCPCSS